MGYIDKFINDDSLPESKAISIRLSLNRKTLKNLDLVRLDGGFATYSMTVARLIDAKAGRIKAKGERESYEKAKPSPKKSPLTLEIPDYGF